VCGWWLRRTKAGEIKKKKREEKESWDEKTLRVADQRRKNNEINRGGGKAAFGGIF
jgi:uncharacterized protein RhaS with RHS repeats